MYFYEVLIADSRYKADFPLIYKFQQQIKPNSVVTVPVRNKFLTGIVQQEVSKPKIVTKEIRSLLSDYPLPQHSLVLAKWLSEYYSSSLGEALKLAVLPNPVIKTKDLQPKIDENIDSARQIELESPLTIDQKKAISFINESSSRTILLHGDIGTGKTRVYLELTKKALEKNQSCLILTPEIGLTSQLVLSFKAQLDTPVFVWHSQITLSLRKKLWIQILESEEPIVIIGARSALFSPVKKIGLIILDEAHEPSYKQDQKPRYNALRVASQLANICSAKTILGSATPSVADYYIAGKHGAVIEMKALALGTKSQLKSQIIDIKDRSNFTKDKFISNDLLDLINETLRAKKQVMIYLNRRGSARLILCISCGWQLDCINCDIPLVYHADDHIARCHICGYKKQPPTQCPVCSNIDLIFKNIGTKTLTEALKKHFASYEIKRFDSDNLAGERLNDLYSELLKGKIDILIGTQVLAKGIDLPRLGLVGVISAEDSISLPDFGAEERTFQLLYQVIGRVGRGHSKGKAVIQSYYPSSDVLVSAVNKDYKSFYNYVLNQRKQFRFPPYSYLLKLSVKKTSSSKAQAEAEKLFNQIQSLNLLVEVLGPAPSFYSRRGKLYYWQLVIKSKSRNNLLEIAKQVPKEWVINLDPVDLL